MSSTNVKKVVYGAQDVKKMLDINLVKTYELFRQPGFPAIKIGRRLIVPKEAFWRWLNDAAANQTEL